MPRLILSILLSLLTSAAVLAHDPGHPEEVNRWLGQLKDVKGRLCCSGPSLNSEHHAHGWDMHGGKPKAQTPIVPPPAQSLMPGLVDPMDQQGYDAMDVDGDCKPTTIKVMKMPDGTTNTVVWNFVAKRWDIYDEDKVVLSPPPPPGEHRAWACINDGRFSDSRSGIRTGHIYCIVPNRDGL